MGVSRRQHPRSQCCTLGPTQKSIPSQTQTVLLPHIQGLHSSASAEGPLMVPLFPIGVYGGMASFWESGSCQHWGSAYIPKFLLELGKIRCSQTFWISTKDNMDEKSQDIKDVSLSTRTVQKSDFTGKSYEFKSWGYPWCLLSISSTLFDVIKRSVHPTYSNLKRIEHTI